MNYRTKTYIAADWDHDEDAVKELYKWNNSSRYGLTFSDAHELKQARDSSLNCSIKKSLAVIVNTCSDSLFSIGQKNCQLFVAKLRNFLDSHNRMVLY